MNTTRRNFLASSAGALVGAGLATCPQSTRDSHWFAGPKSGPTVHDDARGIHREIELDAFGA